MAPAGLGYAPAREARLVSDQAFERAVATSCALAAALFALAFLLRGLLPATPSGAIRVRGPVDLGGYVLRTVPPPREAPVARVRPAPGVPLPVPDAAAGGLQDPAPGPAGAGDGVDLGAASGPAGGLVDPGPAEPATPEPGVWVLTQQLPDEVLRVAPAYPDFAREAGVEGTVHLWALVDLDGSVREVRVRKSVPMLDEAAVAAVSRWRFTPALNNGRPVRVWVAVPVRFSLH